MNEESGKLIITRYKNNILSLLYDEKNEPVEICCDSGRKESLIGNIYIGKVSAIVPSINAAFIEYLPGRMGCFIMDDEPSPAFADPERKPGPVRPGDLLIVQAAKDAQKTKEPVLSSNINLTGKYVVFTLNRPGIRFSSKFKDTEKKRVIKERYAGTQTDEFGFIIRTNSEYADTDLIFKEMEFYSEIWRSISGFSRCRPAFSLLYTAPKPYLACVRDCYDLAAGKIVTDDPGIYEEIRNYLAGYQENDTGRLVFYNNPAVPLKVLYSVEKHIEEALKKKVYLKSGGYIVIEPAEALVSIDVNSGKYVSKREAEREYLKINLEAAKEIARQIRLRNLSGIIIVDFINMKSPKDRQLLMKEFSGLLAKDPQKTTLVDMTKLNLAEITRKKGRRPLYELLDI